MENSILKFPKFSFPRHSNCRRSIKTFKTWLSYSNCKITKLRLKLVNYRIHNYTLLGKGGCFVRVCNTNMLYKNFVPL